MPWSLLRINIKWKYVIQSSVVTYMCKVVPSVFGFMMTNKLVFISKYLRLLWLENDLKKIRILCHQCLNAHWVGVCCGFLESHCGIRNELLFEWSLKKAEQILWFRRHEVWGESNFDFVTFWFHYWAWNYSDYTIYFISLTLKLKTKKNSFTLISTAQKSLCFSFGGVFAKHFRNPTNNSSTLYRFMVYLEGGKNVHLLCIFPLFVFWIWSEIKVGLF